MEETHSIDLALDETLLIAMSILHFMGSYSNNRKLREKTDRLFYPRNVEDMSLALADKFNNFADLFENAKEL